MNAIFMVLDGPVVWLMLALMLLVGVPLAIIFSVIKLRSTPQGAPPPPNSSAAYQVSRDGRVIGTYDTIALRHLVMSGVILPTDFYWTDGMPSWQKVGSRPDLYPPPS